MNKRNAFSLIELMVVMTVGFALLFIGVELVNQAMRLQKSSDADLAQMRSINRLAVQLRSDAHRATDVKDATNESFTLSSTNPSHTVKYQFSGTAMKRMELQNETQVAQETFRFAPGTRIELAVKQDPLQVHITLYRPTLPPVSRALIDREIAAVVGTLPTPVAEKTGGAP